MEPHDELDRILSSETRVVPASGFTAAVMQAVRAETSAPPLAFPWARALPAMAAAILLMLIAAVNVMLHGWGDVWSSWHLNDGAWLDPFVPLLAEATRHQWHWIALAIAMSVASMTWAARVGGARRA